MLIAPTVYQYDYLYIPEDFDDIIELEYDPDENSFYDEWGFHINDIYTMLNPQDVMLFKNDYYINTFNYKGNKNVICIIKVRGELEEWDDMNGK